VGRCAHRQKYVGRARMRRGARAAHGGREWRWGRDKKSGSQLMEARRRWALFVTPTSTVSRGAQHVPQGASEHGHVSFADGRPVSPPLISLLLRL
jgi:hypothetical protein